VESGIETCIVVFAIATSALYAVTRLLPGALVERGLRRLEAATPAVGAALRRFAGRPREAAGAVAGGCSSCASAGAHGRILTGSKTPTERAVTKS
jgi:hypothetical protein